MGRPLAALVALNVILLTGTSLKAQTTVTTLGGGDPYVSPQYLGYRDGNTLTNALFHTPAGLAIDNTGQYLFVADRGNNAIRYLDLNAGMTWTLTTNFISNPVAVAVDSSLDIYALNRGNGTNGTIVEFDFYGDLLATNATSLTNASGMTLDSADNLYVTVNSNALIMITPGGVVTNIATIPIAGTSLQGIVFKHDGMIAACDSGRNGIYLINPTTGIVSTNAGFNGAGDFPTNGNNTSSGSTAKFNQPMGVTESGEGNLIVTDNGNNRVKVVFSTGFVTNLYGVTSQYWGGSYPGWYDGVPVRPDSTQPNVQSRLPFGIVFAPDGTIYTSEDYYHIIRQVTGSGFALPPPAPSAPPQNLTATATYGQITLSWSASTDATNYYVERSPDSGGPYTVIAATASTSYIDTSIFNGATYYYVVSAVNPGGAGPISTQVSAAAPLPPVPNPQIGYVTFPGPSNTSVFYPEPSFDFNNIVPIVIVGTAGSQTYFTYANTTNAASVPNPTSASASIPSDYQNSLFPSQVVPYTIQEVAPYLTIKAIGENNNGSPNSAVVQATYQFITGNPSINGNNPAQFTISDITANAHLYYTLDGSDPSSTNGTDLGTVASPTNVWTVSFPIQTNTLFKVQAYCDNFQPSAIVSNLFSVSNLVANQISFGFASGEASSAFIASPGQTFYAPVTLSLLPSTPIYSLQFNMTVNNNGAWITNPGPAITPGNYGFQSMLVQPETVSGVSAPVYTQIPPLMFAGDSTTDVPPSQLVTNSAGQVYINLETTNLSENLLGVGWLEMYGHTNLYNTLSQDLVSYSLAHDDIFPNAENPGGVIVGGYSFKIQTNAMAGQQYQIQIGLPSATDDGIGSPGSAVYILASTNGSLAGGAINSIKVVTLGQIKYLVGNVYPFGWFNAGDFGNSNLQNDDVLQVFISAVYNFNVPPPGSDFFDAMDSCGNLGTLDGQTGYYTNNNPNINSTGLNTGQLQALFNGNNTTINQVAFGDGKLDVCDVYVTFRRSLDTNALVWFQRFWTNGVRVAVANSAPVIQAGVLQSSPFVKTIQPAVSGPAISTTNPPLVNFAAADFMASAGQTVQIPITASIFGDYPLMMLMLNLTVNPLDGSPPLTVPVQFTQTASALGTPFTTATSGNGNFSAVWLNNTNAGLTGSATIGTLTVTIPTNATSLSAYAIHFDHASATPNGIASFPKQTLTGLITLSSRTNSYYNDGIPDSWRLRYFGTIYNYLSVSNADADGDGYNNWQEYVAGTDPTDPNSYLYVAASQVPQGQPGSIQWPSVADKQYVIQRSTALFPANWTAISTNTGTGTTMQFNDTTTGNPYYYRVQVY